MYIGFEVTEYWNKLIKRKMNLRKLPKIHNSLLDTLGVGSEPEKIPR